MKRAELNCGLLDFSRLPDNLTPLYAVPVINAGAENSQGLSSYISNLAAKHRFGARTLLQFISTYCRGNSITSPSEKYVEACRLDAGGDFSANLVNAIQIMTGVSVSGCCWLKLRTSFAGNFRGINRTTRQWCIQCYRDSRDIHGIVYEPLTWSFPRATVCAIHKARFEECCPKCGQRQTFMSAQTNHWYCNFCGVELAGQSAKARRRVDAGTMAWNSWLHRELNLLVSGLWDSEFNPHAGNFKQFVKLLAQDDPRGYRGLALRTGIAESTLAQWGRRNPPAFDCFVRLCAALGVSPISVLRSPFDALNELRMWSSPILAEPAQKRFSFSSGDWPRIRRQLQQMMAGSATIPAVRQISRMLGVSEGTLRYREPVLVQELAARREVEKARAREIARKHQFALGERIFLEMQRRGRHLTAKTFEKEFISLSTCGYQTARKIYRALYRGDNGNPNLNRHCELPSR